MHGKPLLNSFLPSPPAVDVKARTRGPASAAAVRGCLFDARSRMAVWAELPVVATNAAGPVASPAAAALRLGAKYTSPGLSAGLVVNPASSQLQQAFLVGTREGGGGGGPHP